VAIGALSLVKNNCQSFGIYVGVPAKKMGERKRDLLDVLSLLQNYEQDALSSLL
jgi:galactoside O-acetyltransferase